MLTPQDSQATLQALAAGDLQAIGARLGSARASMPGPGMLQIVHPPSAQPHTASAPMRLLISFGIHGNETAPIVMMAQVLDALSERAAQDAGCMVPDLLLVVGNPAAIALGTRFVDADLNRMFTTERGALAGTREAARADAIMQASAGFFDSTGDGLRWHLDLHSAIRPSRYARFAVIPSDSSDASRTPLLQWLGSAGIEAAMFNSQRASTYSAFTARSFGASSCTVELGQVGLLGQQPPDALQQTREAVLQLLQGHPVMTGAPLPARFRVAQEIIKRSNAFQMVLDDAMHNFTDLPPHAVIATDGNVVHRVGPVTEYIVFPNPKVLIGQRAGLMVVHEDAGIDAFGGADAGPGPSPSPSPDAEAGCTGGVGISDADGQPGRSRQ